MRETIKHKNAHSVTAWLWIGVTLLVILLFLSIGVPNI